MKLFFMSDIHGSYEYLQQAIKAFEREKPDFMILLGDILYHGPRNPLPQGYQPKEVADLLNSYAEKIIAIRGNCDSEVDQMLIQFPILSDYTVILYEGRRIFATHGHQYHKGNLPALAEGDILIHGHTHIPVAEKLEKIFLFNPGSIALPKENTPHSYGVLENHLFQVKDLDGNVFLEKNI